MTRRLLVVVAILLAVAGGAWVVFIEPAMLRTHEETLVLPRWPVACGGLKLAVIADLHIGSPYWGVERVDALVELVRRAQPDIILLAGDYVIQGVVGGTPVDPEQIAEHLKPMLTIAPMYAVLGNHDYWLDGPRVAKAFRDVGINVVEDASAPFEHGECGFVVAGIADFLEGKPNVARVMSGIADDATVLALTHNPDVFPQIPERVALTVAGHTHGGQANLPLIGRPYIPSVFGERYAAGEIIENGKHLFVSTGLGTSIAPIRFRVPPELVVLTLAPAASR